MFQNRPELFENRRHFRLRDFVDVSWIVDSSDAQGEGTLLNVSVSGALLQTDKIFKPSDRCIVAINPTVGSNLPFAPKKGKIVWFRRINSGGERYQCGVEFLKDTGFDETLKDWLDQKITDLSNTTNVNILNNYV